MLTRTHMNRLKSACYLLLLTTPLLALSAHAQSGRSYDVTITNITLGQVFSPPLLVSHRNSVSVFEPGEPALPELADLAEGGATGPLQSLLSDLSEVNDTVAGSGPIFPGESVTLTLKARPWRDVLSAASMLVNTNDTFLGLDNVRLPAYRGHTRTYFATGYDAGSEPNDELCDNIPGPACDGAGNSPEADGEGFIFVGSGIHGIGDLDPEVYDWNNPVAKIVIRRR